MEFYANKFQPCSVRPLENSTLDSHVGLLHLIQTEFYESSQFLNCFKPERFQVSGVFFHFQGFEVQHYYEVFYDDDTVTFHLYFYSVNLLINFFRLYDDDYNLHKVLFEIFHGQPSFVTRDECFDVLFANAVGEFSDVLEPGTESEQQGLLSDELPF